MTKQKVNTMTNTAMSAMDRLFELKRALLKKHGAHTASLSMGITDLLMAAFAIGQQDLLEDIAKQKTESEERTARVIDKIAQDIEEAEQCQSQN